jgi:hypothetical protein
VFGKGAIVLLVFRYHLGPARDDQIASAEREQAILTADNIRVDGITEIRLPMSHHTGGRTNRQPHAWREDVHAEKVRNLLEAKRSSAPCAATPPPRR